MGPSAANKLDEDGDDDDDDDANNASECDARIDSGGRGETHLLLLGKLVKDEALSPLFLGPDFIF